MREERARGTHSMPEETPPAIETSADADLSGLTFVLGSSGSDEMHDEGDNSELAFAGSGDVDAPTLFAGVPSQRSKG